MAAQRDQLTGGRSYVKPAPVVEASQNLSTGFQIRCKAMVPLTFSYGQQTVHVATHTLEFTYDTEVERSQKTYLFCIR